MTNREVVSIIGKETNLRLEDVKSVLKAFSKLVKENHEEKIPLVDLGKFQMVYRKGRVGRNPQDGTEVMIPNREVLVFKVSPSIKKETMVIW